MAIPASLIYFASRRKDAPFPWIFWMFGAFIISCGFTHLVDVWTFYDPQYRLAGLVKAITAVASVGTVIALAPLMPRALALPGIESLNRQLSHEVNERSNALEALRKKNEEMEQFNYTVSHDLKSPLVTIQGFAAHAARDLERNRTDRLPAFIDEMQRAADDMKRLIDSLLKLSRAERVAHRLETVDVGAVVREIVRTHQTQISAQNVRVDVSPDLPPIDADRTEVAQIFDNLIRNALAYGATAPHPHISIGSISVNGEIRYFVRDNGDGVPPQSHERIFELFQRLRDDSPGTGVGLAIVRRIAARHNGRAWIESDDGLGATFWIGLPRTPSLANDPPGAGVC